MKKMQYVFIFIVILAVLVFVGCKKLSGVPEDASGMTEETLTDSAADITEEPDSEEESAPAQPRETTEEDPSAPESTTEDTVEETPTQPSTEPTVDEDWNEYDVLRSGNFYLKGSMNDGSTLSPITLALGENLVYMETTMDGASMGFLLSDKKTYLINPVSKSYTEFGSILSSLLQSAGMQSQEDMMSLVSEMGFTEMKPLDEADETRDSMINGVSCKEYIFEKEDGTSTHVFMNGKKLLAFEQVNDKNVFDSGTYIDEISAAIPPLPPADYEKQNIYTFITTMEGFLD